MAIVSRHDGAEDYWRCRPGGDKEQAVAERPAPWVSFHFQSPTLINHQFRLIVRASYPNTDLPQCDDLAAMRGTGKG